MHPFGTTAGVIRVKRTVSWKQYWILLVFYLGLNNGPWISFTFLYVILCHRTIWSLKLLFCCVHGKIGICPWNTNFRCFNTLLKQKLSLTVFRSCQCKYLYLEKETYRKKNSFMILNLELKSKLYKFMYSMSSPLWAAFGFTIFVSFIQFLWFLLFSPL